MTESDSEPTIDLSAFFDNYQRVDDARRAFEAAICRVAFEVDPSDQDLESGSWSPRFDCGGSISENPFDCIPRLHAEFGINAGLSSQDWRDVANAEFSMNLIPSDPMDDVTASRIGKLLRWRIAKRDVLASTEVAVDQPTIVSGKKAATVEARLFDLWRSNSESHEWSIREMACHLGCSPAAISKTKMWKELIRARGEAKSNLTDRTTYKDAKGKKRAARDFDDFGDD